MPAINCISFKALGILLCYPTKEWHEGIHGLISILEQEKLLGKADIEAIGHFIAHAQANDLYDLQEAYVDTFDRVRPLSLHLFEHVHGESRDRGQAMVDLADLYKQHGFTLQEGELPDYLPAFLEFLSNVPREEALDILGDPAHVLSAIGKRLAERGSLYHVIFDSLIRLTGRQPEKVTRRAAAAEPSYAQLDKEWEEKPIEFLGAEAPATSSGCGSGGCGSCGGTAAMESARSTA